MQNKSEVIDYPLVVDLDGTLIHTDLLWEALVIFFRTRFFKIWRLPFWLLLGKAGFKEKLAAEVSIDPSALLYDDVLIHEIEQRRAQNKVVVLATGSQQRFAEQIADHLKLFNTVLSSNGDINLTSKNKARRLVDLYGEKQFDYVGNASVDVPVWERSRHAYSVTAKAFSLADGRETSPMGTTRRGWGMPLLKAMRPRQWLKNLLVFVPMFAGHAISVNSLLQSLVAFVAFSLCASSAYLLNDTLDAKDDRLHPTKCKRPIAAGTLPLSVAIIASPLLALAALALCASFDNLLLLTVMVYFTSTLSYSFYLKRLLMVDIVALALLYTLRVLGGGASTHIEPSFWLLAFSFFIFLSLALLKRYSELFNLKKQGKDKAGGRGYSVVDKLPIGVMGINSGFLSILVFMLYFNSADVLKLYAHPAFLLGVVPLLVFWLGRLWTLAYRGQVNEDPVLYVSKDVLSIAVFALCGVLVVAASH